MKEQSDMPSWWRCDTHGPGTRTAWGCPECVRELRTSLATATRERDEARAEVEGLRSALGFYSQPVRYDGPNQRPIPGDPYTAADSAYMNDVCRDGGEIAREALAATEAKP